MLSFLGVLALAAGVFWLETPRLRPRERRRERIAFLALLLAGTAAYGAQALGVKIPNPMMILKLLYGALALK